MITRRKLQRKNVYQHEKNNWDEFNRVDVKLQEQILIAVALPKKAIFQRISLVRK